MFDIETYVYREFSNVKKYGNPVSDLRVECPFCIDRYGTPDTKGKLHISINPDRPLVHCFRCDYSTNWFGLVRDITGGSHVDVLGALYVPPDVSDFQNVRDRFVRSEGDISKDIGVDLPEDFQTLCGNSTGPLVVRARMYAQSRGFGKKYWRKYNLGVAKSQGWRIIVPVEGDYWQARALFKWMVPKYTNPKAESRHYLFNPGALRYNEVVVCEGAFSAMAVGDNATALLRKSATSQQIRRFLDSDVDTFIIALEPEAFPSMQSLADKLKSRGRTVLIWKYEEGDPADSGPDPEVLEYTMRNKVRLMLD